MNNLLLILLIGIFALHFILSVLVIKRDDLETQQKLFQLLLIWLIPFVVAVGLFVFYSTQDKKAEPFQREFGGGTSSGIGGSHQGVGD